MILVVAKTTRGASLWVLKMATGIARLHHQGFVVFHVLEGIHNGVVGFPVSGTFADAPIDNQEFRRFGYHMLPNSEQGRFVAGIRRSGGGAVVADAPGHLGDMD